MTNTEHRRLDTTSISITTNQPENTHIDNANDLAPRGTIDVTPAQWSLLADAMAMAAQGELAASSLSLSSSSSPMMTVPATSDARVAAERKRER